MFARGVYVGGLLLVAGCGHHPVGRPPTPAEIAEINDLAAGDPAGMRLYATEPLRPIPDAPPNMRRILSADEHQLTVVTDSGDVWLMETANHRSPLGDARHLRARRRAVTPAQKSGPSAATLVFSVSGTS